MSVPTMVSASQVTDFIAFGTFTHPESRQHIAISEKDLIKQLARVYDQLLAGQVEMDESVRSAIYSDLWGLYEK